MQQAPQKNMKTRFKLTLLVALILSGGSAVRADLQDLAALAHYADQLLNQGVSGGRFVEMVDDRYYETYPYPVDQRGPGMGSYVQRLHAQGLRGRALSDAIHLEQGRRKPLPPGQLKKLTGIPPGQLKKATGIPPGQMKKIDGGSMKPKDKAMFFDNKNGKDKHKEKAPGNNGNGNGKGKKK